MGFCPLSQVRLSSSIYSGAARATPQARHHSLHASVVLGKALTMHPGSEHQFHNNSIWNHLEVWNLAFLLKLANVLDSVAPSLDSERCQSQPTVLNAWLKPLLKIMQILAAEHFLWHGCFERVKSQLTSVWSKHVGPMEGVAGSHLVFQNHLISSQNISASLFGPGKKCPVVTLQMVTLVLNTAAGGVCEAMWTRFSLPQRRRDSWKRMKVDESDYTDYTQKHCPRSKLSLWCRAKAPQCHQRWTGYITSRDSLDDKPTNSYKFTQIHSCLPTFCIRTWLGILVVPSEVKKGKRLRESWAKNGIDHKKLCY